jgi:hypothetical protein
MSESRRILLVELRTGAACMPGLAAALRAAGAQVMEIGLENYSEILDALELGFLPVVLKTPDH